MRWLIAAALLLTCAVTLASATLRLSQSGVGCEPWPRCHAEVTRARAAGDAVAAPATPGWHDGVRLTHRVSASLAGVLYLFIVFGGWSRWRLGSRIAGALLLGDALFLALLGRVTPSEHAGVVLGNLVGGFVLLAALAWLLAVERRTPPRRPPAQAPSAFALSAALLLGAVVTGALLGREAAWAVHSPTAIAASPVAWWAHAFAAAVLVATTVAGAMRLRGRACTVLAAAVLVEFAIGLALWRFGGPSLALAVAHNLLAALAAAGLAWLAATAAAARHRASRLDVAQAGEAAPSAH